jgi:hypothetical protein
VYPLITKVDSCLYVPHSNVPNAYASVGRRNTSIMDKQDTLMQQKTRVRRKSNLYRYRYLALCPLHSPVCSDFRVVHCFTLPHVACRLPQPQPQHLQISIVESQTQPPLSTVSERQTNQHQSSLSNRC